MKAFAKAVARIRRAITRAGLWLKIRDLERDLHDKIICQPLVTDPTGREAIAYAICQVRADLDAARDRYLKLAPAAAGQRWMEA